MRFFRSLLRKAEPDLSPTPKSSPPATDQAQSSPTQSSPTQSSPATLDEKVDQQLLEAIGETTRDTLNRLSHDYLGVLEHQLQSLATYAASYPDGLPIKLVAAELKTFADELERVCRDRIQRVISAGNKDDSNVFTLFQSVYDNASNYTHIIRKTLVRGCDTIYWRGRDLCNSAYPEVEADSGCDIPWIAAVASLQSDSRAELQKELQGARSQHKKWLAAIEVFSEEVDDAVWQQTSAFERYFVPVLIHDLAQAAPSVDWRSNEAFRSVVTPAFISELLPSVRADCFYPAIEDCAWKFLCFRVQLDKTCDEVRHNLLDRLVKHFPYVNEPELRERAEKLVATKVDSGFEEVADKAIGITRECASKILA